MLKEGESVLVGFLLALTFISAMFYMFIWRFIALKVGVRKGIMISQVIFILTLLPYMWISSFIEALIVALLLGIGLSGSLFYLDILIATVMDEDELITGVRRSGGIYGISTFILRYASIFMILSINLVFNSVGWAVFNPVGATEQIILGLRLLMFLFPTIALAIGILAAIKFPISKERYEEIKQELEKLHAQKREKLQ